MELPDTLTVTYRFETEVPDETEDPELKEEDAVQGEETESGDGEAVPDGAMESEDRNVVPDGATEAAGGGTVSDGNMESIDGDAVPEDNTEAVDGEAVSDENTEAAGEEAMPDEKAETKDKDADSDENPEIGGNNDGSEAETEKKGEPDQITVNTFSASDSEHTFEYGEKEIEGITWSSTPEYDGELEGSYVFTPVLPDGYGLGEGVELPEITVTVGEVMALALSEAAAAEAEAITPNAGVISEDTIWTYGSLLNCTVTINKGVTLKMTGWVEIRGDVTIEGGGTIERENANAWFIVNSDNNGSHSLTLRNITVDGKSVQTSHPMISSYQGKVTLNSCTIKNCNSTSPESAAITMLHGCAVFTNSTFINCSTSFPGGAITFSDSTAEINGTTITGCTAISGGGGAIVATNSIINMRETTIENCSALGRGGAIYTYNLSDDHTTIINIYNCTFHNNQTTVGSDSSGGGCIYSAHATINIYETSFIGNKTTGKGGCIYQEGDLGTQTNIYGGTFKGNTSAYPGYEGSGAIYNSSSSDLYGVIPGNTTLMLSDSVIFCGNATQGSGVDGIYLDQQNNLPRKILLSSTLMYPVTIFTKASEGYVIAEGSNYTILDKDLKKIRFVNTEESNEQWYVILDTATNQVKLSHQKPSYMDKCFIYYHGNGAAGTVKDDNGYDPGTTIQVQSAETLSWPGHTFREWNTEPDGSGTSYPPGKELTIESDIDLYAIFTVDTAVYHVEHYRQNLDGNDYTRVESDTQELRGTIDETVTADPKEYTGEYTGFIVNTTLSNDSGVVTADGNLVLRFYYDRNVCKVDFNLNGGSGETPETQTVRYGNLLQKPQIPDPAREGYTFGGWYKDKEGTDGNRWNFADTVENNIKELAVKTDLTATLYAKWVKNSPTTAAYRVEHYRQNLDGSDYTRVESDTQELRGTIDETVTAYPKEYTGEYTGFTVNITLSKYSGVVTADGSLVLRFYYDRNVYNISFDLNGGSGEIPAPQTVLYGNILQKPEVPEPTREGFSFGGWYKDKEGTDENRWNFDVTVENNITVLPVATEFTTTLYAKWIKNDNVNNEDESIPDNNPNDNSDSNVEPAPAPDQTLTVAESNTVNTTQPHKEPKTGVTDYTQFFATIAMISGLSYSMVLFLEEYGMSESEKNALVARLIRWAKQAGTFRRLLAFAAIFLLLVYYHSVGKQNIMELETLKV